ncbi:MAG TPA: arylsulfatase, partial [Phycisphaerae bacterium]|nr:arylsulfatase [Phycisphaerae bacterium]
FPHAYRTLAGRKGGTGGKPVKYETAKTELALYDLRADIGESTNVADTHPDVVKRIEALADAARKDLGDSARKIQGEGLRPAGHV